MPSSSSQDIVNRARKRDAEVRKVLIIEMFFNLLVAAAKAIYGFVSGSQSIMADAVHSTVDASANIVGLVVLHKSSKPPDEKHPYGHRKLEVLASTWLGVSIAVVGVGLASRSIASLGSDTPPPTTDIVGLVVILSTLAVNIFVASYEARKAKELKSGFLEADAAHTASDILVTAAVLASYAASHFGLAWADKVGALLVVGFILKIAWTIITTNVFLLLDRSHISEALIEEVALSVDGVVDCHRIRSRGMPEEVLVDLHVHADGDISLSHAHHISHEVESALQAAYPQIKDVTIHMEPAGDPREEL